MLGRSPTRVLLAVHWAAAVGAAVGAALFAVAWAGDAVDVVTTYGFGAGPSRHSGYGALAEVLFFGAPAAGCFVAMWAATLAVRSSAGKPVVRRALWVTGAIAVAGAVVLGLDVVIDVLNDRERASEARANEQARRIANNHDALAAYEASHGLNQPLTPGGATPLAAAVAQPFPDLVAEFVSRGAVPTEDDLTQAAGRGNPDLVRALLVGNHPFGGRGALAAAFDAGDVAMLDVLADSGMDVAGTLPTLIDPTKLAFHAGEVDWRALRAKWTAEQPRSVAGALHAFAPGAANPVPASEADVVLVLEDLLASADVCFDPALASAKVEPWMKDTRLCTCNYCPYARQIHWALLSASYGEAVPPLERSKHVGMLRTLARHLAASKADPESTVRTAVEGGNVFLLEVLENAGLNVHSVDGEFAEDHFYEPGDEPKMKEHLARAGVTWRTSK
jgi:hypothetical protein